MICWISPGASSVMILERARRVALTGALGLAKLMGRLSSKCSSQCCASRTLALEAGGASAPIVGKVYWEPAEMRALRDPVPWSLPSCSGSKRRQFPDSTSGIPHPVDLTRSLLTRRCVVDLRCGAGIWKPLAPARKTKSMADETLIMVYL